MTLSLVLFLVGILGFVLNRKNIILMLISIEMMLLAVTLLVIISSFSFDDIVGQTYSIYIIAIAGAESAIGLGILVAFYRLISPRPLNSSTAIIACICKLGQYLLVLLSSHPAKGYSQNTLTSILIS